MLAHVLCKVSLHSINNKEALHYQKNNINGLIHTSHIHTSLPPSNVKTCLKDQDTLQPLQPLQPCDNVEIECSSYKSLTHQLPKPCISWGGGERTQSNQRSRLLFPRRNANAASLRKETGDLSYFHHKAPTGGTYPLNLDGFLRGLVSVQVGNETLSCR